MSRGTVSLPLLLAVIAILVGSYVYRSLGHHQPSPAALAMMAGKTDGGHTASQNKDKKCLSEDEAKGADLNLGQALHS